ncbi:hypothetical protein QJS04_geneDACA003642 [Acorus gramineus]|uniref:Nascent polypeptide-associated complex subunit beta n=1 Tax=Acorus gramineus TaxID=55184 RepID=A0AAV9BN42_ACOGR|nr:hypothetical protein QJS04_geneDACA003642 [Acorus gramineus]
MATLTPALQFPSLSVLRRSSPAFSIVAPRSRTSNPLRFPHRPLRRPPLRRALKCLSQRQSTENLERLFSNLNQVTLKREPGSITSGVFLVAGTTVGAGILAIPAVTQEAGFSASAITCIFCWAYMVVTGLLIAEVNVNTMCDLGSGGVSLVSMAMRTLGKAGVQVACWTYVFIHYALLVAYVSRSSDILWESASFFSLVLGSICYFGRVWQVEICNGILFCKPIGELFHSNVVPVLCTNLEGDLSKVRTAIFLGTSIPLVLFLIWDAVILGTIPAIGTNGDKITDPLELLRSNSGIVGPIVEIFSFLAIATSYIGFVLGLSDFLSDLLKLPSGQNKPLPYLLTLLPPVVLSLLDPEIFFKALDFAGTYGVLVLFGILPAAMSWSERYSDSSETPKLPPVVPGGRFTLSILIGEQGDASGRSKQSRSEKKSRKAMLKLGMKPIPGVSRVTVKKSKNAKIEDLSSQLQTQAAEQFKAPDLSHMAKPESSAMLAQDDEDVDETGVEPKDIELVMTQAGVSRSKAVRALKAADGDIVTAIMELTN